MMCVGCTAHMPGGQLEPHMEPSPSNTTLGVLFVLWGAAWFVVRLGFLPLEGLDANLISRLLPV